ILTFFFSSSETEKSNLSICLPSWVVRGSIPLMGSKREHTLSWVGRDPFMGSKREHTLSSSLRRENDEEKKQKRKKEKVRKERVIRIEFYCSSTAALRFLTLL